MKKDSKTTLFIEKAKKIHGTIYDYSLVSYVNSKTKVKILCPIHGVFLQRPDTHLTGSGCIVCGNDLIKESHKKRYNVYNFIEKANNKHNYKYDYSLVEYIDVKTKVKILCPIHGEFLQAPSKHIDSYGCQKCSLQAVKNKRKEKFSLSFIKKASIIHNNKYDYSLVNYINAATKVNIICPVHGLFSQKPTYHLNGIGCSSCTIEKENKENKEKFIKSSNIKYNNKYDYSLVEYINTETKVKIICPDHGKFLQTPDKHKQYAGCRECSVLFSREKHLKTYNTAFFIKRANTVHNYKYDYSLVEYTGSKSRVKIICPSHGEFLQGASNHLFGNGCRECRIDSIKEKNKEVYNTEYFIERSNTIHNNKYDYSLVEYIDAKTKVNIICPVHGKFLQTPDRHLKGAGCNSCAKFTSKAEIAIADYIESLGLTIKRHDRTLIKPLELDIYIPSKKIAIEYNGLYWHTEAKGKDKYYHKNKTTLCAEQGVRLIHIWEDDFNQNHERELNFIKHVLGMDNSKTIFARKTTLAQIDNYSAKEFLDKYHVQGFVGSSLYYGHFFDKELVAVTSFTFKKNKTIAELTRHCAKNKVIGSLGKATKLFLKEYNIPVISFCDLTRFNGKSYELAGFVKDSELAPDYKYLVDFTREHKFLWRRKSIQNKLPEFFDPDLSEREMMMNAGIERVWDCGKIKFIHKPNNIKLGD